MKNGVEELKTILADRSDLLFRHFENCNVATMRWQRGRKVTEIVSLPDGKGVVVERFELLAWAATSGEFMSSSTQGRLGDRSRQNTVRIAARAPPLSFGHVGKPYRKPGTRLMNRETWPFAQLRACAKQKAATR
jgi:hypothetical protein